MLGADLVVTLEGAVPLCLCASVPLAELYSTQCHSPLTLLPLSLPSNNLSHSSILTLFQSGDQQLPSSECIVGPCVT